MAPERLLSRKRPAVVISVCRGMVEAVYAAVPLDVLVLDWDVQQEGAIELAPAGQDHAGYVRVEHFLAEPLEAAPQEVKAALESFLGLKADTQSDPTA